MVWKNVQYFVQSLNDAWKAWYHGLMELRVLRYFLTIAQTGNMTRASQILNLTQPTLSRQIAALEDELGVRLIERGHKGVTLTEDGIFLLQRAQTLVELADRTSLSLRSQRGELSGEVAIACTESRGASLLFSLMASFRAAHRSVRFTVHSANVDAIRQRLDQGLADIGLLTEPAVHKDYETCQLPVMDSWGAIVPASSPLAHKEAIGPEDLDGQMLILPSRREVWKPIEKWMGQKIADARVAATFNLGRNAGAMVAEGVGVALALDLGALAEGTVFVPFTPLLETGSLIAWKPGQALGQAAAAFLDHLKSELRKG